MIKKIFTRISILFDVLKDFLVAVLAIALIITVTLSIAHNLLKINEVSSKYTGVYKKLQKIEDSQMINIYSIGNGENTIVILPKFGSVSPVIEYKSLAESLAENNRVVIVEYLGYGYSTKAKSDRTSSKIAMEVREGLIAAEIPAPYTFLAQDTSSIYAMEYQEKYPQDVKNIITLDAVLPNMINEFNFSEEIRNFKNNVTLTSFLELTGFERILSYVKPELWCIDVMYSSNKYNGEDIDLYRKQIGIGYLTSSMVNEANFLQSNIEAKKNYKYPENIGVLQIITNEKSSNYAKKKSDGEFKKSYDDYAQEIINNNHAIKKVNGDKNIQINNPDLIVQTINTFLYGN